MSPTIVHVFPRSPFLAFTAGVFEEAAPGANTFFVLGEPASGAAYEVPDGVRREWVMADAAGTARITAAIAASDTVVFHSVGVYAARLMAAAPEHVLKVWSGWGGDYYGTNLSATAGLLGPRTRRLHRRRESAPRRAYHAVRRLRLNRALGPGARAADVFSAPIPEDMDVFTRRFPGFRGTYAQLNYASVEHSFSTSDRALAGEDVLVGNSANPTNNHLDVLAALRPHHTPGRRIVVPLSYGSAPYADAVTREGTRLFGDDFVALREFMPLAEYQDVVARCSVVVMGHRRQQAIGNVATALWSGAHVLMDERSPLYRFLLARGTGVRPLRENQALPSGRVDDDQRAANRHALEEFWGHGTVVANARALVALAADRARSR